MKHTAGRISKPLRHNGTPYKGMNVLLLWGEAMDKGYTAPIWMTFKQALELDAHVRKGEHGSLVVYANSITKTETNDKGEDTEREIPFMKGYTVFNVEQIEGLPAHYYAKPENPLPLSERIENADRFITNTGATIHHGGNRAFYAPSRDAIQLPPFEAFRDKESYYATALHELTHLTGHKSRLDRDFSAKRFGDQGYAREELVAELGAAFLCADLGITPEIRDDHAAYLGHWLNVLKEDKRAIFSAAAHAQRAADFLNGLQPQQQQQRKKKPQRPDAGRKSKRRPGFEPGRPSFLDSDFPGLCPGPGQGLRTPRDPFRIRVSFADEARKERSLFQGHPLPVSPPPSFSRPSQALFCDGSFSASLPHPLPDSRASRDGHQRPSPHRPFAGADQQSGLACDPRSSSGPKGLFQHRQSVFLPPYRSNLYRLSWERPFRASHQVFGKLQHALRHQPDKDRAHLQPDNKPDRQIRPVPDQRNRQAPQKQDPFNCPRRAAQGPLLRQQQQIGEAGPAPPQNHVEREGMIRLFAQPRQSLRQHHAFPSPSGSRGDIIARPFLPASGRSILRQPCSKHGAPVPEETAQCRAEVHARS